MTTNEAYQKYLIELQSNGSTDNLQSSKNRFVVNYNKATIRIIEWLIERKNEDDNRYLQKIKILDFPLTLSDSDTNKQFFSLKKEDLKKGEYFDFITLNAYSSKNSCRNQKLTLNEVKQENLNILLNDYNTKPSFKYRDTIFTINEDFITIFKDDFNIDDALLTYYRYPKKIQLQSNENPESPLVEETLEFDDKLTNRIITLATSIHSLNSNDPKYQAMKQEVYSKI